MPDNRQLLAILFTDIEGYTALMQKDEEHAIAIKNRHREILQKEHKEFNGQIIQYYGDGSVSIFQSAIQAVKCAAAMQHTFINQPHVPVRMGLHIGDIVFDNENIFGDGVNLASRIESLGVPGSVLMSDKVNDEVHNHPELKTVSVGTYHLKNIERPVEVFALLDKGLNVPETGTLKGKTEKEISPQKSSPLIKRKNIALLAATLVLASLLIYYFVISKHKKEVTPKDKWIAILPFRLISKDLSLEWLSDGFTEELTGAISGISGLKVKSPTTMMQYKQSVKSIRQIGEELNVRDIIDGSIQKEGNVIVINARLINSATEEILKNFKFKKDASEIMNIYSEVAQQVADVLDITLKDDERERLQQTTKVDPELYSLYLKGIQLVKKVTPKDDQEAIKLFEQALAKDSDYAPALVGKAAYILNQGVWTGTLTSKEASQKIFPLLYKATTIDSNLSLSYSTSAWAKMFFNWDLAGAEKDFKDANKLDPSNDVIITGLIFQNLYSGDFDEAYNWCEKGKALSPNSMWVHLSMSMTLYFKNKTSEAIQMCNEGIARYNHSLFYDKLGWIYVLEGESEKAIDILEKEIKEFNVRPTSCLTWLAEAYYKAGKKEKARLIFDELESRVKQGIPNTAAYAAMSYASIDEKEKAFRLLNKAFEMHDLDLVWLKEEPHFKLLKADARYTELMKKAGFE